MAKLTDVTTNGMVNGAITAIEYGGAVYAITKEAPKVGDIICAGTLRDDVTVGAFYEVVNPGGSIRMTIKDDVNMSHTNVLADKPEVFRKATASAPFAEMVVSRVEAVEKRMDALEGAKDTETLVKGDRVLISGCSKHGADTNGVFGSFEYINGSGDYLVNIVGDAKRLFHREQLTKVAGTEALKVGDYARVVEGGKYHPLDTGDIVEVLINNDSGGTQPYFAKRVRDGETAYLELPQLRKASDAEVAAATPKPKTGDIVVITANTNCSANSVGDIGVVEEVGTGNPKVNVSGRRQGLGNNRTKYSEMRLATPAEIARYETAAAQAAKDAVFTKAGRKPNEYREGDLVRVKEDGIKYAEVKEHYGTGGGGNVVMTGGSIVLGMDVEIVCFAENRADLAKGAC